MGSIINNPVIGTFIKSSSIRTFNKGQTIVYPNDGNSHLYFIKKGAVSMESIGKDGERKVLHVFGASTLFPMVSFGEKNVTSSWFYEALVNTDVYLIPYEKFTDELQKIDGLTAFNMLLRQSLAEIHELLLHISNHTKTDSTEKLVSILLFLFAHHTKATSDTWRIVQFPVTHQFLADMTGLTRETVSIALKDLAKKKLIRYRERGKLELNAINLSKESHD